MEGGQKQAVRRMAGKLLLTGAALLGKGERAAAALSVLASALGGVFLWQLCLGGAPNLLVGSAGATCIVLYGQVEDAAAWMADCGTRLLQKAETQAAKRSVRLRVVYGRWRGKFAAAHHSGGRPVQDATRHFRAS